MGEEEEEEAVTAVAKVNGDITAVWTLQICKHRISF